MWFKLCFGVVRKIGLFANDVRTTPKQHTNNQEKSVGFIAKKSGQFSG